MSKKQALINILFYLFCFFGLAFATTFLFNQIGIVNNNIAVIAFKTITILLFYIIFKYQGKNLWQYIQLKNPSTKSLWLISIYSVFIVIALLSVVLLFIMKTVNLSGFEIFKRYKLLSWLVFSTVIVAPITEEIIFRGIIFNTLKNSFSVRFALLLQAVIFGLIHVNPIQAIYTCILGYMFGMIYYYSESIITVTISHMVVNAVGTLGLSYLYFNLPLYRFYTVIAVSFAIVLVITPWFIKKYKLKN